ncbi:MAG TPA: TrkA family potassium uptake protein [Anaerolineae bacterium]|nr:TrkA family potassium uptake protein [Anaerolineae bacterium]
MNLTLIGGGETIETIYYLARLFSLRGHKVTIVNPHPAEAQMLSRQVKATVILGDGSDPAVLEEAGARQADIVLSLTPYDPDNLVACQIAQKLYGVPRTLALVNDPDNEEVFRRLGITEVFSATRVIGSLIEGQTVFDEIIHLFPADEGRLYVTEVVLDEESPVADQALQDLTLPQDSLVVAIIRDGQVVVPTGQDRVRPNDRLILIALPDHQEELLRTLTGKEA